MAERPPRRAVVYTFEVVDPNLTLTKGRVVDFSGKARVLGRRRGADGTEFVALYVIEAEIDGTTT